jgi:hypothetical protein
VFRTLADLVDAVRLLDEDLAHAIFDGLSVSQRLRAIDAGSIDAWIESLLQYAEGSWTPSIPGASFCGSSYEHARRSSHTSVT